jgi:hypothetical protein
MMDLEQSHLYGFRVYQDLGIQSSSCVAAVLPRIRFSFGTQDRRSPNGKPDA